MEKKSKKSIIVGITVLLLVTLVMVGLTYAYYRTRIIGNESTDPSISVQSKKMEITYADGTSQINMTGKIEPGFKFVKQFTVENTGDVNDNYSILLDKINNTFRREDWKYYLYNGTYTLEQYETGIDSSNLLTTGIIPNTAGGRYIQNSMLIEPGEANKDIYTLVLVYENLSNVDQSEDMGKTLSLRVNIAEEVGQTFATAQEGTLLASIGNDNMISEPMTLPGQVSSLENEALLASTEDDYGTSYYFRGTVDNNYVTYSNMCWRIVRIEGNGNIKLVLADRNHPCGTANGYSVDNVDSAYVHEEYDDLYTFYHYAFPYERIEAFGIDGFDFKKSAIPSVLSAWAGISEDRTYKFHDPFSWEYNDTNTFTMPDNPILDTTKLSEQFSWCNDTSGIANEWGFYSSAYYRLYKDDVKKPSLKCNGSGSTKYTDSAVGILTADEVAFAGGSFGSSSDFYLKTNANGQFGYWTMTPYEYDSVIGTGGTRMFAVFSNGNLSSVATTTPVDYCSIRPAVILKSDVLIKTGLNYTQDGTIDKPYVIG